MSEDHFLAACKREREEFRSLLEACQSGSFRVGVDQTSEAATVALAHDLSRKIADLDVLIAEMEAKGA